jgi:hypothetical protein
LPLRTTDDLDYEGGIVLPSLSESSGDGALFDLDDEDRGAEGDDYKQTAERDSLLLPCLTDKVVQDQLALLADLIDCINHLISCCQTRAVSSSSSPSSSSSSSLDDIANQLVLAFEKTISTLFVTQVITPFITGSSVKDGSCTAIACYIARLVRETSVAEGTVMYLTVLRLLERGLEESRSRSMDAGE